MHLPSLVARMVTREATASTALNTTIDSFVPTPTTRGTLSIVWSCLFTILACSLTIQHLNIPLPDPSDFSPLTLYQRLKLTSLHIWRKLKWLLVTFICPEIWVAKAFQEYMMARRSVHEMKIWSESDGVEWGMGNAYYANMGGYRFVVEGEERVVVVTTTSTCARAFASKTKLHMTLGESISTGGYGLAPEQLAAHEAMAELRKMGWVDNLGGIKVDKLRAQIEETDLSEKPSGESEVKGSHEVASIASSQTLPCSGASSSSSISIAECGSSISTAESTRGFENGYIYPNADQILILREQGIITRLPHVSAREIADKSKTNPFIKIITVAQVTWMLIQVITRASAQLPISQLEISTLAFAACAFLTYLFFWQKPQGINLSSDIIPSEPIKKATLEAKAIRRQLSRRAGLSTYRLYTRIDEFKYMTMNHPPPNDIIYMDGPPWGKADGAQQLCWAVIGMPVAGMIFGGIHCLAWGFSFPTYAETILWRVSSLLITCCFLTWPVPWVIYKLRSVLPEWVFGRAVEVAMMVESTILTVLYIGARFALLVMMFRTVSHLPAEAFVETWVGELPHFG